MPALGHFFNCGVGPFLAINRCRHMELTYKVRGADGKDYGPVSLERLQTWRREGRVGDHAEVMRSDMDYWAPAGQYSELQVNQAPVASPSPSYDVTGTQASAKASPHPDAQLKSSASWFYWIAGFSVINTIIVFTGSNWQFYLGLGVTQFFGLLGRELGNVGDGVALALNLIVAAMFVVFGVFAHKRHTWAFITGMAVYALDGVMLIPAQVWIGVGFHVFVLFFLFRGLKACRA